MASQLKIGDVVELNYAGRRAKWLYQARDKCGVVVKLVSSPLSFYKKGSAYVSWVGVGAPEYWGYHDLNKTDIPLYCLKRAK
jgi:hypothetical protein